MSRDLNGTAAFERRAHALLEESVQGVSGCARSRLNQARHAALAEAARPRRWRLPLRLAAWAGGRPLWLPAAGAVAAGLLVALVLWPHATRGYPAAEAGRASAVDLDLLADREGMDLMQSGDGQFYEWAVIAAGGSGPPAGGGAAAPDKGRAGSSRAADADRNTG